MNETADLVIFLHVARRAQNGGYRRREQAPNSGQVGTYVTVTYSLSLVLVHDADSRRSSWTISGPKAVIWF